MKKFIDDGIIKNVEKLNNLKVRETIPKREDTKTFHNKLEKEIRKILINNLSDLINNGTFDQCVKDLVKMCEKHIKRDRK